MWVTLQLIGTMLLLYFLSRKITVILYEIVYRLFHVHSIAVSITTFLVFPGTVIHELSHLFTAEILGVRTGKLTLVPEVIDEQDIRVGSVSIASSDPFRRAMIGLAPLTTGILACLSFSTLVQPYLTTAWQTIQQNGFSTQSFLPLAGIFVFYYLLLAISNTMFPSPEDMKGVWPLALVLTLILGATFFLGFRFSLTPQTTVFVTSVLQLFANNLLTVIGINLILLGVIWGILQIQKQI